MADGSWMVCARCGHEVDEARQATCPHCLEPLSVKRFKTRQDVRAYQADRLAHGAPAARPRVSGKRQGLALALGFVGLLMLVAAGGLVVSGVSSGSNAELTNAVVQALVPLGIGAGLFQVARQYGGWGERR